MIFNPIMIQPRTRGNFVNFGKVDYKEYYFFDIMVTSIFWYHQIDNKIHTQVHSLNYTQATLKMTNINGPGLKHYDKLKFALSIHNDKEKVKQKIEMIDSWNTKTIEKFELKRLKHIWLVDKNQTDLKHHNYELMSLSAMRK